MVNDEREKEARKYLSISEDVPTSPPPDGYAIRQILTAVTHAILHVGHCLEEIAAILERTADRPAKEGKS